MYYFTSMSNDAPKLTNKYGDFNNIINYILDGGATYNVVKIIANPSQPNTVKVYIDPSIAMPFVALQTIKINGSIKPEYNTQMFIESVNSVEKYFVCYNKAFVDTIGNDETANIKVKIRNAGFTRKFGGITEKRTVIKFQNGIEYRIDDRDWRPLVQPPVTVNATNENWLKIARISMSENYDSLDTCNGRIFPYNNQYPNLAFTPTLKKVGTGAWIQYNRVDTVYYPTQTTSAVTELKYDIFADEKTIIILFTQLNSSTVGYKNVFVFGEFDSLDKNTLNGILYCFSDTLNGTSDYDASSFPSYYPYDYNRNFLRSNDGSNNTDNGFFNTSVSAIFNDGNYNFGRLVRSPEFRLASDSSGHNSGNSMNTINPIDGGVYYCDVILHNNALPANKIYFGKLYNMKWVCSNFKGTNYIDGKVHLVEGDYYYSYVHNVSSDQDDYTTNLIKLTRI